MLHRSRRALFSHISRIRYPSVSVECELIVGGRVGLAHELFGGGRFAAGTQSARRRRPADHADGDARVAIDGRTHASGRVGSAITVTITITVAHAATATAAARLRATAANCGRHERVGIVGRLSARLKLHATVDLATDAAACDVAITITIILAVSFALPLTLTWPTGAATAAATVVVRSGRVV